MLARCVAAGNKIIARVMRASKMKTYQVFFKYEDPYPKQSDEIRMQTNSHGTAINRALKEFRKTIPHKHLKKVIVISTQL